MFKQEARLPLGMDYGQGDEATIELLPGHSHDELVKLFQQANTPVPQQLAPGFYSGKVPVELRRPLQSIARAQRKAVKKMH